ncbi:MAG: hypothetical protein ACLTD2_09765 [Ruminococcus sp.]
MYKIEKKENYEIYAFDEIDLRIKIVNNNLLKNVYINYKGYNPLFTMLLGEFSADCEIDSIHFDVKSENSRQNNTLLRNCRQRSFRELFIKDIYFFIIENKIEQKLNERDKSIWSF